MASDRGVQPLADAYTPLPISAAEGVDMPPLHPIYLPTDFTCAFSQYSRIALLPRSTPSLNTSAELTRLSRKAGLCVDALVALICEFPLILVQCRMSL